MSKTRYFDWNLDNGLVIEYARGGECKKCGICCGSKIAVTVSDPYGGKPGNGGKTTDGKGLWHEINRGRWRWFFKLKEINRDCKTQCGSLTDEGLCGKYRNVRSRLCKEWPFSPHCLEKFPSCGYEFAELNRWKATEKEMGLK